MDKTSPYYRQVALLVRALPYVANETCFALKGEPRSTYLFAIFQIVR